MAVFRLSVLMPLAAIGLAPAAAIWAGVWALLRRSMRRHEAFLRASYSEEAEARMAVAKSVHPRVSEVLMLSKSLVHQAVQDGGGGPQAAAALARVSALLAQAVVEGDRAFRSLERGRDSTLPRGTSPITETGHSGRKDDVFCKANPHHDR